MQANTQLTKICFKNIFLTFPLSYENVISDCFEKKKILVTWMLEKTSGLVHFQNKICLIIYPPPPPHVIQNVHVFLSSVVFEENISGFFSI